MYYYYFADMESLRPNVREVLEDIFLILNDKWDYSEIEETGKMLAMFENPKKILSEVMSIREINVNSKKVISLLNLTEEEKRLAMVERPEEWVTEMINEDEDPEFIRYQYSLESDKRFEQIKILAIFILKIAVYRFCVIYFPKILRKSEQSIQLHIDILENEMYEWEKQFWTVWVSHGVEVHFYRRDSLADKRGALRREYSRRFLEQHSGEETHIWEYCISAFKDMDTVECVKKMRQNCIGEKQIKTGEDNDKNYVGCEELRHMKQLLDIFDKNIQGRLTTQDVIVLKENAENWNEDIKKLKKLVHALNWN